MKFTLSLSLSLLLSVSLTALAQDKPKSNPFNEPLGDPGIIPAGADGKPLNLNFEDGTLKDWKAEGKAWDKQPVKGEISQTRTFGEGKKAEHTGQYWVGGYEFLQDPPVGTLTSSSFEVTQPFGSFLIGGGQSKETRVELVTADDNKVFFAKSGQDQENLRPVIVDLTKQKNKKIYIRIVDQNTGGWGHVNFDDFRLYKERPRFKFPVTNPNTPATESLYPHAGLSAEEAAKEMVVPPGFKVQVAAAEPDVQQPIAMAIDDRGRVWIAEAYTYPTRAPEGKGKDRIIILEDTDLDGKLDKRTVFIEGLNLVSGLEVGFGGVWVGAAPYLLFIPDKNGDDVPDGPPMKAEPLPGVTFPKDVPPGATVLLDGWGYEDTHETLNSFIWGPDGWLYGCHGVFTKSEVRKPGTPKDKVTKINAGIWRYHPVRHEFEVFAEGTSNPWGLDYDQYGNFFATACVIPHCYHIIPGARYERQAGNHWNPYTYDDIKTIADHRHYTGNQWNDDNRRQSDELGGGHAHAGCMIYQGGAWPEKYRGMLFMNNIHGNRMNMDVLTPKGSGFICSHGPDFLLTRDQWSQMLYMTYGPDGQVWVIDWYDRQQCHERIPDKHDRSNGRIYRIVYNDAKPVKVDLGKMKDEELVKLLQNENRWYARHAQRILQERTASGVKLSDAASEELGAGELEMKFLRDLWAIDVTTGTFKTFDSMDFDLDLENGFPFVLLKFLFGESKNEPKKKSEVKEGTLDVEFFAGIIEASKKEPALRSWFIRQIFENKKAQSNLMPALVAVARTDDSPAVRLSIASQLQRIPVDQRWKTLEALTRHSEDANDPNLPLMYWYAMEPLADVDPKRALALGLSAGEKIPILKEYMIRRIGAGDPKKSLALLVEGLKDAKDDATRLTFLRGMNESLKGRRGLQPPEGWSEISTPLVEGKNAELRMQAISLAVTFGDAKILQSLRDLTRDASKSLDERRSAIRILATARDNEANHPLRHILNDEPQLRSEVIRALAVLDDERIPAALVRLYNDFTPEQKREALAALCGRVANAKALLEAIEAKKIPANHLTADLVTNLRSLNDADLQKLLEKSWGTARETAADKKKLIEDYKQLLGGTGTALGARVDVELGRAVFARTCQQCHTLFGTGGKVGPDITGSQRANLDYLLSNVLDPSAVMAKEYQPTIARLADGRVVTGILKAENAATITLLTQTETLVIPIADIEERKISDKSMMPDDLLKPLMPHEVRSLVAYVSSPGQTPMLATADNLATFYTGKDLVGWRGDEKLWSVENGEIVGKTTGLGHNAFLVSELSLGDFRLEVEVKLLKNEGNSGIQLRSQPMANGEVKGYQADIGAGWWGKLYEENGRGLLWDKSGEAHVKNGDWNKYEIIAVGSRVQTFINGQPCVDLDDSLGARRGVIALQLHSGGQTEVRYKNLKLTLLPGIEKSGPYPTSKPLEEGKKLSFKRTKLDDKFHSEGVGYGDFNNDGRLDIAAGSVWYECPTDRSGPWKMHSILEKPKEFSIKEYSDTFMNWAEDLDGDGRQDLIVVDFPGAPTWWFQNPGDKGGPWARNRMVPVTNNESPQYLDVDKDGKRELIYGDGTNRLALARPGATPLVEWSATRVAAPKEVDMQRFYHGLGIGDINKDGRDDIVVPNGWWEAPEKQTSETWPFHAAPLGAPQAQMQIYDFDGDGDADVLGSSAHQRGIWWYEQQPENKWVKHEIDSSIAQTHALVLADINGDGLPDFVTGKRYYAHNGRDPGEDEPPVIAWYELSRKDGKPVWTQHVFDHDSGVGTAFEVHDMNGDGLQDVIVANKRGVFYFEQTRE